MHPGGAFLGKTKILSLYRIRLGVNGEAAMQSGDLFSQTGLEFLSIGESSGNLPDMLDEFAKIQEQELFTHLRDIKAILEPALVVIIATMIFAVMAVMLSPLFDLMTRMPEYT
jgi:type II secretory pathway component PulF